MGKIAAFENVTLDGVMQAPAYKDEDRRGGFEHGGWATPYADEEAGRAAASGMAETGAVLLGRVTYEDFASVWPQPARQPVREVPQRGPEARRLADAAGAARLGQLDAARDDVIDAVARLHDAMGPGSSCSAAARSSGSCWHGT